MLNPVDFLRFSMSRVICRRAIWISIYGAACSISLVTCLLDASCSRNHSSGENAIVEPSAGLAVTLHNKQHPNVSLTGRISIYKSSVASDGPRPRRSKAVKTLSADSGGRVVIPSDYGSGFHLLTNVDGFVPAFVDLECVRRSGKHDIDMMLTPGHTVRCIVVDDDNRSVSGASVWFCMPPIYVAQCRSSCGAFAESIEWNGLTDEGGMVSFQHVPDFGGLPSKEEADYEVLVSDRPLAVRITNEHANGDFYDVTLQVSGH